MRGWPLPPRGGGVGERGLGVATLRMSTWQRPGFLRLQPSHPGSGPFSRGARWGLYSPYRVFLIGVFRYPLQLGLLLGPGPGMGARGRGA